MAKPKEVPEFHQTGHISLENLGIHFPELESQFASKTVDFGVQIAKDGRVWICIDGISLIRFSPHPNAKMAKD